jgi:acetylornithine deacetylase/succinyl-diaminopimelate desuccinylase-like protein
MDDAAIRREATELTADLIRIDTGNPPGNEAPAAHLLRAYLEAAGVDCELVARDVDRPNLVARIPGTGEGPSLALCGHTDVVPADEPGWTHPPFAGHVDDDGWLWGRGAVDMKNQTATRAVAIATLARSGFRPKGDLVFIAQADEEDGTSEVGMRWLVRARPDLRVDYAIDEGGGDRLVLADGRVVVPIETGQKAVLPVAVTALGVAGHASRPRSAANAVPRIAELVRRIHVYEPARRTLPATGRMLDLLAGPEGELDERIDRAGTLHAWAKENLPALFSTTMAPTRLQGSSALNVMPARAVCQVDCRVLPGTTEADLERELRDALGDDLPYELSWLDGLTGGAMSDIDSPLYRACQSFLDEADPGALLLPVISTGFADSHYLREVWGTVAFGFWPYRATPVEVHDAGFHNVNERVHTEDLGYGVRAMMHVVHAMLD